jgi:uncharacterized protein (TIGR02611 family)
MGTKPDQHRPVVGVLDRIRGNRTGRLALRIGIGALGAVVIALGIALIPLPGPGWGIVIVGLAIWSLEFIWAKRLLGYTKRQVQSWTHWVGRQPIPVRILIGAAGLIFVSAVVWASVRVSFGINLMTVAQHWLARH